MPLVPETAYTAVVEEMTATTPSTVSKLFSMPCLKNVNGKAFAGYRRGAMVFKLPAPSHGKALALAGSHLFDPSGKGRPMKEWVVVPADHADLWLGFARAAWAYVTGEQER